MTNTAKLYVPNSGKLTWGELKRKVEEAGIKDEDEIDNITVSWGSAVDLDVKKDEIFGWQIYL